MYSYEEAFEASKKYFNGDELAAKVFIDKYSLRNNENEILEDTPERMHWRLAKEFARIEKRKYKGTNIEPLSKEEVFSYFDKFKYIVPQGSPMYGIGNKYQYVSLSNCYVLPTYDSYGGILQTDEHIVQISKRRGGSGHDISPLRPRDFYVKNSAKSTSGAVSFMNRFSNTGREVGQFGRRSAQMITISCHHPDILEFIKVKSDKTKVTGANISVRLSNEFLEAVKKNKKYELRWPVDAKNLQFSKDIDANLVWNEIVTQATNHSEPGILFWDNILQESPADCYEEYQTSSTNPCQPSWSKMLCKNSIRTLSQVNIGDYIWTIEGWSKVVNKQSSGIQKVYKYSTNAGVFFGTKDHKIVSNDKKIKVKNAESIDMLAGPYNNKVKIIPEIVMDGLIIGDGSKHKASNNLIYLCIGQNDYDYFNSEIKSLIIKKLWKSVPSKFSVKTSIKIEELNHTYNRKIPTRFICGNKNEICSFLRGIYSANGCVDKDAKIIKLSATSLQIIEDVQCMLSSIGIRSYYTITKKKIYKFKNGKYEGKQKYNLNITVDREKFYNLIGFIQKYKMHILEQYIEKMKKPSRPHKIAYDITSVEFVSEEEVFDITVDNNTHTFWSQGLNISNCSEIPLSPFDSCRLLCLNLFSYVNQPFTKNANFDYKLFYEHSQIAQRLMDDIVNLELEHIDKIINKIKSDPEPEKIKRTELDLWINIKKACINGKRTGTGITGLGDTLAALNAKYGSKRSILIAEDIYKVLKFGCYRASINMAKAIGPFPLWDYKKEKNQAFLNRFKDETIKLYNNNCPCGPCEDCEIIIEGKKLYNDMKKYGRRNIALLTIAPTGTVSIQTQTTSGIEPAFMLKYTRRKKGNPGDDNFKTDFVDESGDHWQEFEVYHPKLQMWMGITGEKDITKSPWHESCAEEIDWQNRVKLQAAVQKHCDHAISSTLNLPEDVSVEEVKKIYETAWKSGCKGITVYRKNSRTGVLIDSQSKPLPTQRPKELACDVHHLTVKGEAYFVLVGLFNDVPFEVFAGKNGVIKKTVKKGKIIRVKKGTYNALLEDGSELTPSDFCNNDEEAVARMTSIALRGGTDLHEIVLQLEKVRGDMLSFAKSISRALKKYLADGIMVDEACPKCESKSMARQEGCVTCLACGYSKCS